MKSSVRLVLPLVVCSALLLAGCSSASDPAQSDQSSESSAGGGGVCDVTVLESSESGQSGALAVEPDEAATDAAMDTVTLSKDAAAAPTVTFDAPLDVTTQAVLITDEGSGDTIEEGQIISVNYMVCDMVTGEKMYSTWGANADEDSPFSTSFTASAFGDMVVEALSGEKVGTRFLWGQPGYSADQSYTGVASNGYLYVMSVTGVKDIPDEISGTEVEPTDKNLPVIDFESGKPVITIPDTFVAPTDLVVQPLVEGDGETVEAGQTVAVKYSGWLTDGTPFDSSWDQTGSNQVVSFPIGQGAVITGWDQGLVGQKVGSRLLLVIPSDLGYGETGSGTIPANSDLVFVVDILAAY
ncbi:MAG: FKBP-type peptidyl-prolyl cis-trans isomerase [Scrofimicrobium sp.]